MLPAVAPYAVNRRGLQEHKPEVLAKKQHQRRLSFVSASGLRSGGCPRPIGNGVKRHPKRHLPLAFGGGIGAGGAGTSSAGIYGSGTTGTRTDCCCPAMLGPAPIGGCPRAQ